MLYFLVKFWFYIVDVYCEVMILKLILIWFYGVFIFLVSEKRVFKLKKRWKDFEGIDRLLKNVYFIFVFIVFEFIFVWKYWIGLYIYVVFYGIGICYF